MVQGSKSGKTAKARGPKSGGSPRNATSNNAGGGIKQPNIGTVPFELQQRCLNVFRDALEPDEQDSKTVQEVKGHLYNRDFGTAFGNQEYLKVYASRWSPSRALGYLQIFNDVQRHFDVAADEGESPSTKSREIVCLGGGAGAELVALAGWLSQSPSGAEAQQKLDIKLLDIASWESVVECLQRRIVIPPELSKYASAAAKEANKAMLSEECIKVESQQRDLLEWPEAELKTTVGGADLVTLMFTLNELYSTNMAATQHLLARLTDSMQLGSHLLVVDSPGSYSTVSINGAEKKYPMQWLLDYTLLGSGQKKGKGDGAKWAKVESDESRWFRLSPDLRYPIELENMRFQLHLYRRVRETPEE
ncbi:hypothetical protein KC331_g8095 [Hortaea werneckii]|uniref:25S rRNA (Uridine(2843)-N(3))-methyltransferase n=1 Tax=Hortaea werneckii TaxID=91943 RepID=A0A3M7B562_HORWE|nr:hypothetical protein KC331_g8095 [Hortaea werneckii]KAI7714574.1 hypothetical protein KC353_g6734 [Hortaea werneckii]RMY34942.1 hypothetical protein D0865_14043 [Hortaea werneckii]